ncbi:19563_t:CDS:2 [Cetraspora pellucida]|uniref:19563_t:CDS:1 n=1 Tax=Cetraspora pellucida TaxID=1433469 RepID=A0A9N9HFM8_9GLOM|nr:19563_t:CDS:2 [Cetraspora pellucida]
MNNYYDNFTNENFEKSFKEPDSSEILEYDNDSEDSLFENEYMDCKVLSEEENQQLSCIIINNLKEEIQYYNLTNNLRSVFTLVETWKIEIMQKKNFNITTLSICSNHFNFD